MQDSQSRKRISEKFTATHRLLRKDGFNNVLQAEKISDKYFKIFFACNGKENARLGIVTSKRMLSRAVDRNRVKRMIRQVFRQHEIKLCRLDIVVMLARTYAQQNDLQSEKLQMLFSRLENRCQEL